MDVLKVAIRRNEPQSDEVKLRNNNFRKQYFALHRTPSFDSQQRIKAIATQFETDSNSEQNWTQKKVGVSKKVFSTDETKLCRKNAPISVIDTRIPIPLPRRSLIAQKSSPRIIVRPSPKSSTENIHTLLDSFLPPSEMDKDLKKKRSNSFRSKIRTIFTNKDKEKKSKDDGQKPKAKKTENAVFADNAQNESFNRQTTQRHSFDAPRRDIAKPPQMTQSSVRYAQTPQEVEQRYAAMYINNFQQRRNMFANPHMNHENSPDGNAGELQSSLQPQEEYVCMDKAAHEIKERNYSNVTKYDSSSSNTIESETSTTSVNQTPQQSQVDRMAMRSNFFNGPTPPRMQAHDVIKGPTNERVECIYGTVFDAKRPQSGSSSITSLSPRSPSVERTKLTLPLNREKIELQPRLRSPVPTTEVSTDKLIATELLKGGKRGDKLDKKDIRSSPSHQKLEIEIDYPTLEKRSTPQELEASKQERRQSPDGIDPDVSPQNLMEAAQWQQLQRDLDQSPAVINHALPYESSDKREVTCSTPTTIRGSTSSFVRTSPKHEIRQNVEAFCWKELKKMKEQEEQQLQILISSCGYAEDPIRRSRSMAPTARHSKRSTSLPREVLRQRRTEDMVTQQRQRESAPMRPIFNRGSLTRQAVVEQPIYNKKVSFRSPQNPQNPTSWPTKKGFTQSPPQRRMDMPRDSKSSNVDDEVFLPNEQTDSRNDIFKHNQQKQKELLLAKAAGSIAPVPVDSRVIPMTEPALEGVPEVLPMRSLREPIYGQMKAVPKESPYGTRINPNGLYNGSSSPMDESVYRTRINSESPYGTGSVSTENPHGNRSSNESPYGTRPQIPRPESLSSRASSFSESPYGTREIPNASPRMVPNDNPHATRVISPGTTAIARPRDPNEIPYGIRRPGEQMGQQPIYKNNPGQVVQEPIYGTRPIMGNVPRLQFVPPRGYQAYPQQMYGPHVMNIEPIYGSRQTSAMDTSFGPRPYGPSRGMPPRHNGPPSNIARSNSLRQTQNYNKAPSGIQHRPLTQVPGSSPGRYDFPPDSPPRKLNEDPTYTRRVVSVNQKVCDIYGQIHESQPSPQQAGVLYGQLQRNTTVAPMQYQSYQQLQASNNFVRGTRLTASVNDMHRYNNGAGGAKTNVVQRSDPPNRPLPPIPDETSKKPQKSRFSFGRKKGNENGSPIATKEEWNADGKRGGGGQSGSESGGRSDTDGELRSRIRNNRREESRRHTLGGSDQYGTMASSQGGPLSRTMDLEGQPRGYPPPSNAMLFDDDPGIMSEVETSSTGFRRGGKQRSSLPVVRTPSKTLERPLGLVFLQYRNETKRALLPNEITSIDTVKALFVRSFPKQLTMEYLDSPQVKIYIHDSSKDMFYELEDLRSHLREIRDRSVLRLFESADVSGGLPMAGIGIAGGAGVPHFEDPSYFSEPEFDSEYQHQHIHKSKSSTKGAPYYIGSTASLPRAGLLRAYSPAVCNLPSDRMKTLPSGAPPKPQRAYSSGTTRSGAAQFAQRPINSLYNIPDGYMSSPERGSRYEEAYYSQYGTRSGSITPVIDEEISDTELIEDQYSLYGVKMQPPPPGGPRPAPRTQFATPAAPPYDTTRIRVENMERQLANLTGLVQKALTQTPSTLQVPSTGRDSYRDDTYVRSDTKPPKLGKSGCHKSVSFEKSVSFSDEPPDMNSPKQHSPQHTADTKPTKPAIKSSTLPRTSSQERDRLKPAPPPKPASLSPGQYDGRHIYRDMQLTPEMYNQLRGLQKKAKELRSEVRNLRRMSQAQAHSVRETIRDTFIKIRAMLMVGGEQVWQAGIDQERVRLSREEDLYKQEMIRLETDLSDLESTVEELRGNVINRKTRVNMSDVENMALILSKSSKTVADLKLRFPMLQNGLKSMLGTEMEKVVREEKFLKEEPERLESALRRCKKLTGTLVTLKRLASVQEQRLPCSTNIADGNLSPTEVAPATPTSAQHSKPAASARMGSVSVGEDVLNAADSHQRPENALDALLDELQTFAKPQHTLPQVTQVAPTNCEPPSLPVKGIHPPSMHEIGRKGSMDSACILPTQTLTVSTATGSLRRLHSYPSGSSDTDNSPPIVSKAGGGGRNKPPLPERNADLLQHISSKRVPPPPPPRTSSKSPLASPTSPNLPPRCSPASNLQHIQNVQHMVEQTSSNKPMSQFEAATQNLGLGTLRRNVQNRGSLKDAGKSQTLPRNIGSNLMVHQHENTTENFVVESTISASNSSSCESVNSQDGTKRRKEELEHRHQELLKKQKALQEQYARLQQLQRGTNTLAVIPPAPEQLLKKTGSESNILQKMGLQLATSQMAGSLTNLPLRSNANQQNNNPTAEDTTNNAANKVFETDIL